MTPSSTNPTPTLCETAAWQPWLSLGLSAPGHAWRWPLVLGAIITLLFLALAHSGWNPWVDNFTSQSLLAHYSSLSTSFLGAFAKPPWQWPSLYSVAVFVITQSLVVTESIFSKIFRFSGPLPAIQLILPAVPATVALIGLGLWLVALRTLLHQWKWPPMARWAALTVLATHPAVWASVFTGAGWQGALWTLLLLKAPSIIVQPSKNQRPSRLHSTQQNKAPTLLVTPVVLLGCLVGVSPWLLGIQGFIGALAIVMMVALVCRHAQSRSTVVIPNVLRPLAMTVTLLGLLSGLTALISHKPFMPFTELFLPLLLPQWTVSSLFTLGGFWLAVALIVSLFHPTSVHLYPWQPHLRQPIDVLRQSRQALHQPPLCWPKHLWIGGVLLGALLSAAPLSALWLCIGIGQTLTTLTAEAPLKGNALCWLDAMGVVLILSGLGAAVLLFQWCPDRLPWVTDTQHQSLVSLSLGTLAWEVAWWKLAVSGWLLSLILLGFGLLLRGHRLSGQEGLGLTAASILWGCAVLHAGILPWVQPTPAIPTGLVNVLQHTAPFSQLKRDPNLSTTTQQIVTQTLWHSTIQAASPSTDSTVPHTIVKNAQTLHAMPEIHYYQTVRKTLVGSQAVAFQKIPVVRLWPHPTRGWLDTESLVWVLSKP